MPSQTPEPKRRSTAALVTVGAAWFMSMRWTIRGIGVLSTVVLARALVPADFGLVAIAAGYLAVLDSVTDLGVRTALVRNAEADRHFTDTVFTLQLIRGIGLAGVVVISGFILPGLIGENRLAPVIWVLSFIALLSGLINPRMALFERRLDFRREAALQITSKLLSTTVAIVLALTTHSYWALIGGMITQSTAKVVISYLLIPYLPRLALSAWRELLRLSGWLSGSYMLDAIGHGFDSMIIGGLLNVRAAGLFNVAAGLSSLPLGEFLPVVNRALFPGLLRFKEDPEKLRLNVLDATCVLAAISLPMGVGFSFVAREIVTILYGSKWSEIIPIVQALSINFGLASIGGIVAVSAAMATDRTKLMFWRAALGNLIRLPVFILATWLWGLSGAIGGYFFSMLIALALNLTMLRTLTQSGYLDLFSQLWRTILAVAMMALVLFTLGSLLPQETSLLGQTVIVFIKVFVGAGVYAVSRLLIWKITGTPQSIEIRAAELLKALLSRVQRRV